MPENDPTETLTTGPTIIPAKEAAAMLGIHLTTLYEAARRGEIPCQQIGRRFIFVREVLHAWLLCEARK